MSQNSYLSVTEKRWLEAQKYELATWARCNSWYRKILANFAELIGIKKFREGDDWNKWWYDRFEFYQIIPKNLEKVIEFGCGPYTNVRLIMKNRIIKQVICSDPLANSYTNMKGIWLASEYKKGTIFVNTQPLEECSFPAEIFDVAIIINVLDHVRDVIISLENATRVIKPKGFLVLGQDLTDEEDIHNVGEDLGHPIRIHEKDLDRYLLGKFIPKLYKKLKREDGRNPCAHYGTYIFIGEKG